MLDIMFEIPKDPEIGSVTITRAYLEKHGGPRIEMREYSAPEKKEALPGPVEAAVNAKRRRCSKCRKAENKTVDDKESVQFFAGRRDLNYKFRKRKNASYRSQCSISVFTVRVCERWISLCSADEDGF